MSEAEAAPVSKRAAAKAPPKRERALALAHSAHVRSCVRRSERCMVAAP